MPRNASIAWTSSSPSDPRAGGATDCDIRTLPQVSDRGGPVPETPPDGEGAAKQRLLEERYLPDAAREKYGRE